MKRSKTHFYFKRERSDCRNGGVDHLHWSHFFLPHGLLVLLMSILINLRLGSLMKQSHGQTDFANANTNTQTRWAISSSKSGHKSEIHVIHDLINPFPG